MPDDSQIPMYLYRGFERSEYATDFIEKGRFRLGLLESYIAIEDKSRRDPNEGRGQVRFVAPLTSVTFDSRGQAIRTDIRPGLMDHESVNLNCKYLLCCSSPDVNHRILECRFGPYIVRVDDPCRLANDITTYLERKRITKVGPIEWVKIRYDKGQVVSNPPDNVESTELTYLQKDIEFADEQEWRLVVMRPKRTECDETLWINFDKRLEYVNDKFRHV